MILKFNVQFNVEHTCIFISHHRDYIDKNLKQIVVLV